MFDRRYRIPQPSPYRAAVQVIGITLVALALLALDLAGTIRPLRAQAESLLSPALTALRRAGDSVAGIGTGFEDARLLREELAAVREANGRLTAENIRIRELEIENARLREQLRIEQAQPWQLVGAEVSAATPDSGRRVVLLAAGEQQGVREGMAVIGREGASPPALIGVVEQTGPRSAVVLLITDYSSAVSALAFHEGGTVGGIVQGQWQRGSRLLLQEIERGVPLSEGDVIVTAGLSAELDADLPRAAIPRSVPIGTIESIGSSGRGQVAELRPFVDPDRVRFAWVILSAGE